MEGRGVDLGEGCPLFQARVWLVFTKRSLQEVMAKAFGLRGGVRDLPGAVPLKFTDKIL